MIKTEFARILIDPVVEHSPLVKAIRRNARGVAVSVEPTAEFAGQTTPENAGSAKRLAHRLIRFRRARLFEAAVLLEPAPG